MAYYNFKYPFALAESQPSLMGGITVPSQQTPITPQPQQTPNPMGGGKNDKLALMLYALGGALRGDKNFMQNTLQLQQMQEGKKKQKEQEKAWEEWKDKNLNTLPESFQNLAAIITPKQGINLAIQTATAKAKPVDPSKAIKQEELNVLNKIKELGGDVEKLSSYEKLVYDNFIKKEDSQSLLEQLGLIPTDISKQELKIEKIEG